ncbi:hypothetical protein IF1G_04077 [Cordyceps javanica]|uniref:Uncharacterized protein n=1 Tax=Cordyceps javanica TaxID=43265 RepID=A0A545V542_9HYPO|nr:hypothetical protein IF1G_04077 [Cordyceps javanica]
MMEFICPGRDVQVPRFVGVSPIPASPASPGLVIGRWNHANYLDEANYTDSCKASPLLHPKRQLSPLTAE